MKVCISYMPVVADGFLQINGPHAHNLDEWVSDSECTEMWIHYIDYIPGQNLISVLQHYISKLRLKGTIIFTGTDLIELCKAVVTERTSTEDANVYFYQNKKCCIPLHKLCEILEALGLNIKKKKFEGLTYVVECTK